MITNLNIYLYLMTYIHYAVLHIIIIKTTDT